LPYLTIFLFLLLCICFFTNQTFICCASIGETNNTFFILKALSGFWLDAIIMLSTLFFLLLVSLASSLFSFSNKKNFFPIHKELLLLWQFTISIKIESISFERYISFFNIKTIYSEKNTILLQQEYYLPRYKASMPWQLDSKPR